MKILGCARKSRSPSLLKNLGVKTDEIWLPQPSEIIYKNALCSRVLCFAIFPLINLLNLG